MSELIDQYMLELESSKQDIKDAILNKGGAITGGLSSYAQSINELELGGGGASTFGTLTETIVENGLKTYTPAGVDGWNEVNITVDVPIPTFSTQSKEVTITENGTQTVAPDSGYDGLSSVEITVDVASSGGESKPQIPNGFRFTGGDIGLVDFSQYDWSCIYDGSRFFQDCNNTIDWSNFEENFNGVLLSADYMFSNNGRGNYTPSSVPVFDTSNLISADYMFEYCKNLTTIPNYDFSNVLSAQYMFSNCINLALPALDFSNCKSLSNAFNKCNGTISFPPLIVSNCENFSQAWYYCTMEEMVGDYNFLCATDLYQAFNSCTKLKRVDKIKLRDASDCRYMFQYCGSLTDINLEFIEGANPCNCNSMFQDCTKLVNVSLDGIKSKSSYQMFYNCSKLTSLDASNWDFSNITGTTTSDGFASMFLYCYELSNIAMDLSNNTNNYSTYRMFRDCGKLTNVNITGAKPFNCEEMFRGCKSLTDYSFLSSWDLSKATTVAGMFQLDTNATTDLHETVVPALNTVNATNMRSLFIHNKNISKVMGIDLSSATDTSGMFDNCTYLSEVYLKGDPSKITSSGYMFNTAGFAVGGGILYYDSRYDYAKIIKLLPSNWTSVPYDFE